MKIYYRISDKSYPKKKLFGTSKKLCLENFVSIFPQEQMSIVADNCEPATVEMVKQIAPKADIVETSLGNAGSFRYCLDDALIVDDEIVYFVEDDYLHFDGKTPFQSESTLKILEEGLSYHDYVTLYDHPDKYCQYDKKKKRYGEACHVCRSKNSHWRTTISTCMTFASWVRVLREDKSIWDKHISGVHPNDHSAFVELNAAGRKLGISIPNRAVHTDDQIVPMHYQPWFVEIAEANAKKIFEEAGYGNRWNDVQKLLDNGSAEADPAKLHHRLLILQVALQMWRQNETSVCQNQ